MRLGGPCGENSDPKQWANALKSLGYSAAYCPVGPDTPDATIGKYIEAAERTGIVLAEVGAWSNPISCDEKQRCEAMDKCAKQLALADRIGARCCVNIAGSRSEKWDGPHASHYSPEVFDLIVESVRKIIDHVNPRRTFYTLETMPWAPPDSADSYEKLIKAIDRKQFGVHFDPVNIINSPEKYYHNAALIRNFVSRLGGHIRSVHAKDILLQPRLTVHLDEVRPGTGGLDYKTFLGEISRLDADTPIMLEHLKDMDEYANAAGHLRKTADSLGVKFR